MTYRSIHMVNSDVKKAGFLASVREIVVLLLIVFIIRTFGFGLYQVPTGSMETTMLVGERFFADKFTILFSSIKRGDIIAFNDPTFKYSKNKFMRVLQDYVWGPSNWTKRVIGIPGDELKGTIEDGRPVVYLNGKKLNEPYLNKYPLIRVWNIGLRDLQKRIQSGQLSRGDIGSLLKTKSYDPQKPFEAQAFYQIKKDRIYRGEDGQPVITMPGTPMEAGPAIYGPKVVKGDNYWNNGDEFYVKLGANQYWLMGDNRLGSTDCRVFGPIDGRLIHGKILFRIWSHDSDENWWILDLLKHPVEFWSRFRWSRFFQSVK